MHASSQLAGSPVSCRGPPQILRVSRSRRLLWELTHTCLSSHCNLSGVHNFAGHIANQMLGLDLADVLYVRYGQRKILRLGFACLLLILFSLTQAKVRWAMHRATQTFKTLLKHSTRGNSLWIKYLPSHSIKISKPCFPSLEESWHCRIVISLSLMGLLFWGFFNLDYFFQFFHFTNKLLADIISPRFSRHSGVAHLVYSHGLERFRRKTAITDAFPHLTPTPPAIFSWQIEKVLSLCISLDLRTLYLILPST